MRHWAGPMDANTLSRDREISGWKSSLTSGPTTAGQIGRESGGSRAGGETR